jgi:hypothetical protein
MELNLVKLVTDWLSENAASLGKEFEVVPLLNKIDDNVYMRYEQERYDQPIYIFDPEYSYSEHDFCKCCGYFEHNEYDNNRIGYCAKYGEDLSPFTKTCNNRIILKLLDDSKNY